MPRSVGAVKMARVGLAKGSRRDTPTCLETAKGKTGDGTMVAGSTWGRPWER